MRIRAFWVAVHRWAGLTIALFLVTAGLTGSLLAFHDELDVLAAPSRHLVVPPQTGAAMLAPQVLRDKVMARYPGGVVTYLPLRFDPGRSVILRVDKIDAASGRLEPWSDQWDEVFVDPYTGATIGQRRWGDISQGAVNFMPFVYRVHYSFAVGRWGLLALGLAALIWTLDCFVGFYLTFPVRRQRPRGYMPAPSPPAPGWLARWGPAWRIRWRSNRYKLTFDLHRAGGLWLWPLLLVFAWSSVSFNLPGVYQAAMRPLGFENLQQGITPPSRPRTAPALDFRQAEAVGRRLALSQARRFGIAIAPDGETGLLHRADAGVYAFVFTSSADMRSQGGRSLVIFDSQTGRHIKTALPAGQTAANTVTEWISAIHMAAVWGLPWRIATALIGLGVTMLSGTGVILWMRKKAARRKAKSK